MALKQKLEQIGDLVQNNSIFDPKNLGLIEHTLDARVLFAFPGEGIPTTMNHVPYRKTGPEETIDDISGYGTKRLIAKAFSGRNDEVWVKTNAMIADIPSAVAIATNDKPRFSHDDIRDTLLLLEEKFIAELKAIYLPFDHKKVVCFTKDRELSRDIIAAAKPRKDIKLRTYRSFTRGWQSMYSDYFKKVSDSPIIVTPTICVLADIDDTEIYNTKPQTEAQGLEKKQLSLDLLGGYLRKFFPFTKLLALSSDKDVLAAYYNKQLNCDGAMLKSDVLASLLGNIDLQHFRYAQEYYANIGRVKQDLEQLETETNDNRKQQLLERIAIHAQEILVKGNPDVIKAVAASNIFYAQHNIYERLHGVEPLMFKVCRNTDIAEQEYEITENLKKKKALRTTQFYGRYENTLICKPEYIVSWKEFLEQMHISGLQEPRKKGIRTLALKTMKDSYQFLQGSHFQAFDGLEQYQIKLLQGIPKILDSFGVKYDLFQLSNELGKIGKLLEANSTDYFFDRYADNSGFLIKSFLEDCREKRILKNADYYENKLDHTGKINPYILHMLFKELYSLNLMRFEEVIALLDKHKIEYDFHKWHTKVCKYHDFSQIVDNPMLGLTIEQKDSEFNGVAKKGREQEFVAPLSRFYWMTRRLFYNDAEFSMDYAGEAYRMLKTANFYNKRFSYTLRLFEQLERKVAGRCIDRLQQSARPYLDVKDGPIHTDTVVAYAKRLCQTYKYADIDIVLAAATLHDVGWKYCSDEVIEESRRGMSRARRKIHERYSVEIGRMLLLEAGYSTYKTDEVLRIIGRHDSARKPLTIEEAIVMDADKLWRYDEIGFTTDMSKPGRTYATQLAKLKRKLHLKGFLHTPEGTRIAERLYSILEFGL